MKEINKTKQFKDNINRQEKILNDINLYVNATLKKQKPDVSKKEKEKLALKKVLQSYYVGYDPDEDDN